jgi:hypothetical protein
MNGDIEEACFEEATWEFLREPDLYPKVEQEVNRFQKLWERVTGQSVHGWRPWKEVAGDNDVSKNVEPLSPERTIEIASVYFTALTEHMRTLISNFKNEDPNIDFRNPSAAQRLNTAFASTAQDAGESALTANGSTLDQFQASVQANAENPSVGRALAMIQMQHQQQLQGMALT